MSKYDDDILRYICSIANSLEKIEKHMRDSKNIICNHVGTCSNCKYKDVLMSDEPCNSCCGSSNFVFNVD